MSTIGGDGVNRGPTRPDLVADLAARAMERARLVAAALEARHAWGPHDTALLLDEVRQLPAGAQEVFLAASARGSRGGAGEWADRIARACPAGAERKPAIAMLTRALDALGSVDARTETASADTVERSRGYGPFGGPLAVLRASPIGSVAQPGAGLDATAAAPLEGLPAPWHSILVRVGATAAGLASGLAPIGRAEGLIASVREGLARPGEGEGVWARARRAAGEDALGRVAPLFEALRARLNARLDSAKTTSGPRGGHLADLARDVRGRAAQAREQITSARELLGEIGLDPPAQSSPLGQAEAEMRAADYGLEAYAVHQDLLSARPSGEGRIGGAELDRLGTGLTPPPPQGFWNIGTVGAGMEPALSSDEYCQAASKAVVGVLGENPASVRPIEGAELAAAVRDMGVLLEQVDPAQLNAALSYINTGASGAVAEFGRGAPSTIEEQRERLSLALRQFRCLAERGPAAMDRKTAIDVMWSAARVPAHAFEKMSDAEVLACAQQVALRKYDLPTEFVPYSRTR